jgi:flavin-binding protein dodecin
MSNHVYKLVELAGSSPEGMQQAIENAVVKASETIRNLRWFEVLETRGQISEGQIAHWQVKIKVGFTIEDEIEDS